MTDATLLLGTNLGDRNRNIATALSLLEEALGGPCEHISPIIETQACGFEGPAFLNCAAVWKTDLPAEELLDVCKAVERRMGRRDLPEFAPDRSRIYHDRIIDIDILLYGGLEISSPRLTIPHPQIQSRPFVKELLQALER